ncbi:MAG: hypothetical protein FD146_2438 [Anaerolineaceae bacterium]|nr:MAG: hypothetical protein FD146_2438 [Anaerolineaceae bacterium]
MIRLRSLILPLLLAAIVLLLPAAACAAAPVRASSPWTADDLRLLDPAGDAATPATDLLAVYVRTTGQELQIRVDLLNLSFDSEYKLGVFIFERDKVSPPLGVFIEPGKVPRVFDHATSQWSTIQARVVRDPWLDTITISFNRNLLADRILVSVGTFLPSEAPADLQPFLTYQPDTVQNSTGLLGLDDPPPSTRAPALIAFTDSFPAATPAQALRRWDGAHTGPTGERHGLRHVLGAARANSIPIVLLDLKTPSSLAALDFLGVTGDLRQMTKDGLLLLPDAAYGEPAEVSLDLSRRAADGFGLPRSPFVYAASGDLIPGARFQFVSLPDASRLSRSGGTRLIPLPAVTADPQAAADGPSLAVRRALMDAALSSDPADLVTLGGSLPNSTWGQADIAAATFEWLAAHPWVHVLDADDLKSFPIGADDLPTISPAPASADIFLPGLQAAPDNAITDSAWQAYFMLTAPTSDENLRALRLNYLGQVGTLTAASLWADDPFSQYDCSADTDHDLQPECILANDSYFAVIETNGARLTHLFYGEHQLVGPTAQFAVGLSDPSTWNVSLGDAADPGQVMGAFFDETQTYQPYSVSWPAPGTLALTSADGGRVKTFRLTEAGLEAAYQADGPVSTRIPLAVDPQLFFAGPVEYLAALSPGSWTWGPGNGTRVRVRTDAALAALAAEGFTVSIPLLGLPENPDLDYPAGHYYPFPLSVAVIRSGGSFRVQIGIP